MACSIKCCCGPDAPPIGSPYYARGRGHPDAGDLDALRRLTYWLTSGEPFCHVRYADGELKSILGTEGKNTDGQPYLSATVGQELHRSLLALEEVGDKSHLLVGGDWSGDPARRQYLERFFDLPWCPSQIFVNGIVGLHTLRFLEAVRAFKGYKLLISNRLVSQVAPALGAQCLSVAMAEASNDLPWIERQLYRLMAGDESPSDKSPSDKSNSGTLVLYCAGLAYKPLLVQMWRSFPSSTQIDIGCLFDGAVGINNRSWLEGKEDLRLTTYRKIYVPWLLRL